MQSTNSCHENKQNVKKNVSESFFQLIKAAEGTLSNIEEGKEYDFCLVDSSCKECMWMMLLGDQGSLQKIFLSEYDGEDRIPKEVTRSLKIDDMVVARWSEDLNLYRGRIEGFKITNKSPAFEVRFVDYGNLDTVKGKSLFLYHPVLDKVPWQSVSFNLSEPSQSKRERRISQIKSLKTFRCRIDSFDINRTPQAFVTIVSSDSSKMSSSVSYAESYIFEGDKVDIVTENVSSNNKVLMWMNKAQFFESPELSEVDEEEVEESCSDFKNHPVGSVPPSESSYHSCSQFNESKASEKRTTEETVVSSLNEPKLHVQKSLGSERDTWHPNSRELVFLEQIFPARAADEVVTCILTDFKSSQEFHVMNCDMLDEKNEVDDWMNRHVDKTCVPRRSNLVAGSCWAAWHPVQGWRRVSVIKLQHAKAKVDVRLIDFGSICQVDIMSLAWLPLGPPCEIGPLAFCCSMYGDRILSSADNFIEGYLNDFFEGIIVGFDETLDRVVMRLVVDGIDIYTRLVNFKLIESQEFDLLNNLGDSEDSSDLEDTDSGDSGDSVWDPMSQDFYDRKNTAKTRDNDPEVAIMGHCEGEDLCHRFLLFGKCPKGEFCPRVHKEIGRDIEAKQAVTRRSEESVYDLKSLIPVELISTSLPFVTVLQETVSDSFRSYTISDIREFIEDPSNPKLCRTMHHELRKLIGLKLPEYGWVRAMILEESLDLYDRDVISVYLVDYGVTLTCAPQPSDMKELNPAVQNIPFLVLDCLLHIYEQPDCEQKVERFLEFGAGEKIQTFFIQLLGHVHDQVVVRLCKQTENLFHCLSD